MKWINRIAFAAILALLAFYAVIVATAPGSGEEKVPAGFSRFGK